MTVQTVKLGGKAFVIVLEKEFRQLQRRAEEHAAQDRGDVAESKRRLKQRGGKTLVQLRRDLGL